MMLKIQVQLKDAFGKWYTNYQFRIYTKPDEKPGFEVGILYLKKIISKNNLRVYRLIMTFDDFEFIHESKDKE